MKNRPKIDALDPEIALIVGVNAALIYQKIRHFCGYHEGEGTNFHDGLYWSYNTHKGIQKQFPYLSVRQVRTAVGLLLKETLIISGNYNKFKNDRTLWYTINPDFQMTSKSIVTKDPEVISTNDPEVIALTIVPKETKETKDICERVRIAYNEMADRTGLKKCIKINPDRRKNILARLKEHDEKDLFTVLEKVEVSKFMLGENKDGWTASIDFIYSNKKFLRILEGNYANRSNNQSSSPSSGSRPSGGQPKTKGLAGSFFREARQIHERQQADSEIDITPRARESEDQLPLITDGNG